MKEDDEDPRAYEMPEDTPDQVIDKISAMASEIRNDWSDPRSQCRAIWALCTKLKKMISEP